MLKNAYLLAKIGADTAENERNFAENLPKIGNRPGPLQVVVAVEAVEAPQRRGVDVLREREEVGPAPPDRSERRGFCV